MESVVSQNFPESKREIIVVDGNSTDNTNEILNEYKDLPNFFVKKQTGTGLSNAVNLGIASSHGKYILRLDADDVFYQGIIEKEYSILEKNPHIDFVYPDYMYFIQNVNRRIRKYLPVFSKEELMKRGDFLSGGTMYRKTVFNRYGSFDESIPTLDNYEFILRLMLNNVVGYHLPEPLFEYTIHGSSLSDEIDLIEKTGALIAQKYGITYHKNVHHPRNIPTK